MDRDDRPFAFAIMPFSDEWTDVYELGIRPACDAAGARCERVDEQIFLESILHRIYGQIERADLVIAEMSGRNPNVFYETGFAHGIGKPVILLTRTTDDIPFDLRHYPHVVYAGRISTLKQELEKRVRWLLENPEAAREATFRRSLEDRAELDRMAQHITNYLVANHFSMVSFETVRERIEASYTDERLLHLIDATPDLFRRVQLRGGRAGIGLV
jgi:hypothetical protein